MDSHADLLLESLSLPGRYAMREHQGSNCSLFNNTVVTDESQIKDSTTRDLEAAVLNFSKDRARIDTIKDELQTQKDFLKHEKNEIERDTKAATNTSQRRAVSAACIGDRGQDQANGR